MSETAPSAPGRDAGVFLRPGAEPEPADSRTCIFPGCCAVRSRRRLRVGLCEAHLRLSERWLSDESVTFGEFMDASTPQAPAPPPPIEVVEVDGERDSP